MGRGIPSSSAKGEWTSQTFVRLCAFYDGESDTIIYGQLVPTSQPEARRYALYDQRKRNALSLNSYMLPTSMLAMSGLFAILTR
jgi:hypothetical protein